jgi:hypothetical protein
LWGTRLSLASAGRIGCARARAGAGLTDDGNAWCQLVALEAARRRPASWAGLALLRDLQAMVDGVVEKGGREGVVSKRGRAKLG